ncbi:MAG TPA: DinB family protein [Pyrinomonadaceae bacterium]|nr:DinB family protein [Pyrinomonadaceae bacterium]
MVETLGRTPESLRRLASGLSDVELRWKPSDEEFSVLEHVCHLSDIEREGYAVRVARLLEENEPFLPDLDGSRLADERAYNRQLPEEPLETFTRARVETVARLKNLSAGELSRGGTLEGVGALTLEDLLGRMSEHDTEHLRALEDLRRRLFELFDE